MKEMSKIISVLTCVCIACAFSLSFVFSLAKEKIAMNEDKTIEEAIFALQTATQQVEEINVGDTIVYTLFDNNRNLLGYAFLVQGQGYQGKIKILAVIEPSLQRLQGIEIVESVETPGLGAKIQDESFKKQFKELDVIPQIEYVKGSLQSDNQVQAITGATISSRAVVNILNKRIEALRKILREQ